MLSFARKGNAPVLAEDLPDRARGARQAQAERLQVGILAEEIQDGLRPRDAVEIGGGLVADGEDGVNHALVERGRRMFARAGLTVEHDVIIRLGGAQAFAPLFHPAVGSVNGLREVADSPVRVGPQQGSQGRPISQPLRFHDNLQPNG